MAFKILNDEEISLLTDEQVECYQKELKIYKQREAFVEKLTKLENAEIKPLEKDGLTGYSFKKDDMTYICFERDGRFFSVYGTADADELLKVAAGITKK